MNARSLFYLEKLKEGLSKDQRFARANVLDDQIENDAEIAEISKKMQALGEEYARERDLKGPHSEEAKEKAKSITELQEKMNAIPFVAEYNGLFREVSSIYLIINDILFGDFNKKPLGGCHD